MKKFFFISILFISTLSFVPEPTFAADTTKPAEYTMLAPIPGLVEPGTSQTNLAVFLPAVVKLMIGLATAFALLMIFYGGIQYLTTAASSGKSAGRDTITNAIVGLLLTIGAYTLLYTINPRLVSFSLAIENNNTKVDSYTGVNGEDLTDPGRAGNPANWVTGASWPPDDNIRAELVSKSYSRISFNAPNCKKIGDTGCTSLYGISSIVHDGLLFVQKQCNCQLRITGGTEFWLHSTGTQHTPGGNVLDFSLDTDLKDYLKKLPRSTKSGCTSGQERYEVKIGGISMLFVNEDSSIKASTGQHWHTCFTTYSIDQPVIDVSNVAQ